MKTIKVGLVQQSNTADTKANLLKLARNIEDVCRRGAQLVILQELHNSLYFCQTEDTRMFDLAEPIPGPSTGFFGELARQFGIVLVTSLFEKRAAGLYHNTAVVFDTDGSTAGTYRKMHIPTTRPIMRSSTSPRATWVSTPFRPRSASWAYRCAGTSGIPKAHG